MAISIKRKRNSENEIPEPPKNGFDLVGKKDTQYNIDLDKLEELKRRDSTADLVIHNDGASDDSGSLSIKTKQENINISQKDYKKSLLDCYCKENESTIKSEPTISFRRPIVIWEDGNKDITTEEQVESLYDRLDKIDKEYTYFKNNYIAAEKIDVETLTNKLKTDRKYLPTVGAVYDYINLYIHKNPLEIINDKLIINNCEIEDTTLKIPEDINIELIQDNLYQIVI